MPIKPGSKIEYTRPEINTLANRPEKVSLEEFARFAKLSMREQRKLLENGSDELLLWALEKMNGFLTPESPVERIVSEVLIPKIVAIMKRPVPKPLEPNLNLQNFWNPLMIKFPKAVQLFSDWIDSYKEKHRWRELMPSAKFHDLPIAIQTGLMELFFHEKIGAHFCFSNFSFEEQCVEYSKLFELLNR